GEEQGRDAFLVYLVDDDVAHRPQCRRLAKAGQQTRLAEKIAGCKATDFLHMSVVLATLSDDDACPDDHEGRQHPALSGNDLARAVTANRGSLSESLLLVVCQPQKYRYCSDEVDGSDACGMRRRFGR